MKLYEDTQLANGLLGGVLLGLSSSFYLRATGRMAGMSSFVDTALTKVHGNFYAYVYLAGLFTSGALLYKYDPSIFGGVQNSSLTSTGFAVAGILTGFGTRMGNGCTSGHGICGLPRLSVRSLVAVCSFMFTGAVAAYFSRVYDVSSQLHYAHKQQQVSSEPFSWFITVGIVVLLVQALYINFGRAYKLEVSLNVENIKDYVFSFISALLFGLGLGISGMCDSARVIGFLDFSRPEGFDPSLMAVMGGGVAVNLYTFHKFASQNPCTLSNSSVKLGDVINIGRVQENTNITASLVIGSALFGIGWGVGGVCPGPALVSLGGGLSTAQQFVPWMCAGIFLYHSLSVVLRF